MIGAEIGRAGQKTEREGALRSPPCWREEGDRLTWSFRRLVSCSRTCARVGQMVCVCMRARARAPVCVCVCVLSE